MYLLFYSRQDFRVIYCSLLFLFSFLKNKPIALIQITAATSFVFKFCKTPFHFPLFFHSTQRRRKEGARRRPSATTATDGNQAHHKH
ncbi:hypothetical protein L6452_08902 [Arctium lappa]|uniref:Uncharacterized protein n=1 Tax=Arctium lappa TaxID=4217 RepID=A0ACB9DIH5_ARCLA|nr:hypothetical protein L6452_08902 [Arctium lappa]